MIVRGRFAGPRPSPSAQLIAVPCEKPPSTIGWRKAVEELGERDEARPEASPAPASGSRRAGTSARLPAAAPAARVA